MKTSPTLHLVYGPTAAGKSTCAQRLAREKNAVRFALDDWMHSLYGPDLPPQMDFDWIMVRVQRCRARIQAVSEDILKTGRDVILEMGFQKRADRAAFETRTRAAGFQLAWYFVDAPADLRKQRTLQRNTAKGETFSFEVTPAMFDFMEGQFERPDAVELSRSVNLSGAGPAATERKRANAVRDRD